MLDWLVRYIRGYYIIVLTAGNIDRFLNISKSHSISFYNIEFIDKKCHIKVASRYVEALKEYAQKAGVTLEVNRRVGLKYFFDRYRKRKIFFLFCLLFVTGVYISSLYIWSVDVSCHEIYSEIQIEKYIKENYVPIGTKISEVDCAELEKQLREEYDQIAWVSCELKGCTLSIEFSETMSVETLRENREPCNIVAIKDALVLENIVNEGVMVAHKGDEVKKGDILISGSINIANEYDEIIETAYVAAFGYVYGRVTYEYEDEFEMTGYEKEYTGRTDNIYSLYLYGNTIKLPNIFSKDFDAEDIIGETKELEIFDYKLPIGISTSHCREYEIKRVEYTEEEVMEKAKLHLEYYMENLRKKGVVILENNVKIITENGLCKAKGTIVTKELIGAPSDIIIINQGDTP